MCASVLEVIQIKLVAFLQNVCTRPVLVVSLLLAERRYEVDTSLDARHGYDITFPRSVHRETSRNLVHTEIIRWLSGKFRKPFNICETRGNRSPQMWFVEQLRQSTFGKRKDDAHLRDSECCQNITQLQNPFPRNFAGVPWMFVPSRIRIRAVSNRSSLPPLPVLFPTFA